MGAGEKRDPLTLGKTPINVADLNSNLCEGENRESGVSEERDVRGGVGRLTGVYRDSVLVEVVRRLPLQHNTYAGLSLVHM